MIIPSDTKTASEMYGLITQVVVPRPVAWILSDNGATGSYNLAPFSYFNAVTSDPPILSFSIGNKAENNPKDTRANIEARKHFVVNIADASLAAQVSASAEAFPHGISEIEKCGLATTEVDGWSLPRLSDVKVALLCRHYKTVLVGNRQQGLVLGEIISSFVADEIVSEGGDEPKLDISAWNPLARLGGADYCEVGKIFEV